MTRLRQGTIDDIENICRLLIDTWQGCYSDFMPTAFLDNLNLDRQIKRHEKYFQNNVQYFVIENEQKKILGFTSYGKNRFENLDDDLELYTIYVDHREQGKGFGKMLLNGISTDIQNQKKSILVAVFEANPFKHFYLKNGFIKIGDEAIDMGEFNLESGIYRKML